jgi:hypothetical protein
MLSSLSLSGVPQQVLDMTTDFSPLFVGLVVILGFSLLGIAFAIGVHDTRKAQAKEVHALDESVTFPKAA